MKYGWMLLAALATSTGCARAQSDAVPAFNDRTTMRLGGPVSEVVARVHVFAGPGAAMQDALDDPSSWQLPAEPQALAAAGIEATVLTMAFDREGWLRRSDFSWADARGWTVSMRFSGPAGAVPSQVEAVLAPPPDAHMPDQPLGTGSVRYPDPLQQVIDYSGRQPGDGSSERYLRRTQFDAEGRQRAFSAETTAEGGAVRRERTQAVSHDAAGRMTTGIQVRDGVESRFSNLHLAPDRHGNPTRLLKTYRAPDADPQAPVQRAELILYEYRYDHEAG